MTATLEHPVNADPVVSVDCVPGTVNAGCACRQASHVHGERNCYVIDRCRGAACREAIRVYEQHRRRQRAYGRHAYADAAPAVEHVRSLMAAGLGWKRIAEKAGVASSSVYPLLYGRPDRNGGRPRTKARKATVDALLAVPMPGLDDFGGGHVIDGTGTRRRLQALVAIGWAKSRLADRLGWLPGNLGRLIEGSAMVTVATARAVRALYDELWSTAPETPTRYDRASVSRARRLAAARGWQPPMAWDDDTIDEPEVDLDETESATDLDEIAIERAIAGDRATLTADERLEAIRRMHRAGLTDRQIGARLGAAASAIADTRRRKGISSGARAEKRRSDMPSLCDLEASA